MQKNEMKLLPLAQLKILLKLISRVTVITKLHRFYNLNKLIQYLIYKIKCESITKDMYFKNSVATLPKFKPY